MASIQEQTDHFAKVTARTLADLFGVDDTTCSRVTETNSVTTDKAFIVSLHYTGTVYGEYLIAMDEATAAGLLGLSAESPGDQAGTDRDSICSAMSETLNLIVGESIVQLQKYYAKLTLTAPRIFFGEIRYPQFRTGMSIVQTPFGQVECHFCLDSMRLDLATSYSEALESLVEINGQLKLANQHLAQQQARLVQTEKMASVGMLASGVAHEINNPLFFVDANLLTLNDYIQVINSTMGLYEKLCESIASDDGACPDTLLDLKAKAETSDLEFVMQDTKDLVDESREGVKRIKQIVQGLKDFSQSDSGSVAEADVSEIAENTCALIASQLPIECRVVKELQPTPAVVCNSGEIGHALAGVIVNAGQAVASQAVAGQAVGGQAVGREGKIRVATSTSQSSVMITVEDNGGGIAPEHIDHLFEPFFTTKPVGQGSGLGLAIAFGILEKHHGSISVESELGRGTKVTMRLPLAGCNTPAPDSPVSI